MIAFLTINQFLVIAVAALVIAAVAEYVIALRAIPHHDLLPPIHRRGRQGRLA